MSTNLQSHTDKVSQNHSVNYNEAPYVKTSLIDVTNKLPIEPPCRILFKNEWEQPSGSFKLRGIGNLIQQSILQYKRLENQDKEIQVFASSGGNAGLAAAYTAFFYNLKCTVVLPVNSKPKVQDKLKGWGAKLILQGSNINEADKYLKGMLNEIRSKGEIEPIYCHPFDNPLIWDGHASLVDELTNKSQIKGIVCSCGGGGLYNGIYEGMIRNNMVNNNNSILLLETQQAPTLFESLEAEKLITLNNVNSLATSLACSYTTNQTMENFHNKQYIETKLELVDDLDAIKSCISYYNQFKTVVEPACGTALSVVYDKIDLLYKHYGKLNKDDVIVIVVCGGSCCNESDLQAFEKLVKRSESRL
ncbi:putative catabolic L-serine/threonine dehydratase [Scheffersomyces coipomensis]|uniref:putative catabolic L-serine/threonine dehydratase n=1 Tax=Scheffersomyces coipomensis TaxID=1788519 RepID=UPI00315D0FAF